MSGSGTNVGTAVGYLNLNVTGFQQGLGTAQQGVSTLNNSTSQFTSSLDGLSKGMVDTGENLTKKITVPVIAAGAGIVATSLKFESGLSKVAAISGATGEQMDQLKAKAIEMGAKTTFSASESADAFSFMASAGWSTNEMLDGIQGVMTLASAAGEDLALTSDICTNSMTAFGMQANETQRFVDVLAMTANASNSSVADLGESFQYIAPVAGAMGYSVEDVSVALGIMANNGIKASSAGTALRGLLTNLVKPTDDMATTMEQLNIHLTNSDGTMKPLNQIITEMRGSFSGLTAEQKASAAATLAGKEGMSGLLAIVNASDEDFNGLTSQINNSSGAAQKMADVMNDNLKGQFTALGGVIETVALQFGDILLPVIKDIVEKLSEYATWVQGLDEGQRKIIVTIALVAAAIGPLLIVVGKMIGGISGMITAFSTISAALPALGAAFTGVILPVLAIVAAVAAVVAIFIHLYNTNENVRNALNSAWVSIKEAVAAAIEKIQPALERLKEAFSKLLVELQPVFMFIAVVLVGAFAGVVGILNGVIQAIGPLIDAFTNFVDFITNLVGFLIALFTGDFDGAWEHYKGMWQSTIEFVKNIFSAFWEYIKGWCSGFLGTISTSFSMMGIDIKQKITDTWNNMVDWIKNMVDGTRQMGSDFIAAIVEFFTQLPIKIKDYISTVILIINDWVKNMIDKSKQMGADFIAAIVEFFTKLPERVGYFIGYTLGLIVKWNVTMIQTAIKLGTDFINAIVEFFTTLPGKIYDFVTKAHNNIITWKNNMITSATELGTNFIAAVVKFFTTLPGKIYDFATAAYGNIVTWKNNMINAATTLGTNFINTIVSFFTTLPGKVKDFVTSAYNNISTWANDTKNKAAEMGSNFINTVVNFFTNLPGNIKTYLTSAINEVANWGSNMASTASSGMGTMMNTIINKVTSLPASMIAIGKNVVQGIWKGIADMADWLGDKVSGFSSGVLQGFKDALGIKSPARKAMPIGMYTAQGFGIGLVDEMGNVKKDIQESVTDAIDVDATMDSSKLSSMKGVLSNTSTNITDAAGITTDKLKEMLNGLSEWFDSVEMKIAYAAENISKSVAKITTECANIQINADGTISAGYVGYNGYNQNKDNVSKARKEQEKDTKETNGDTFIFNSPKALSEIECAKQMKKTKQELAESL